MQRVADAHHSAGKPEQWDGREEHESTSERYALQERYERKEQPEQPRDTFMAQDPPMARLYTLGTYRLLMAQGPNDWIDLTDSRLWGHGRAQDLLLLLLLRRQSLARIEAAAMLWPEADVSRRARLLRNALWNLRQLLTQQALSLASGAGQTSMMTRLALQETPHTLRLQVVTAHMSDRIAGESADARDVRRQSVGQMWSDVDVFEATSHQARVARQVEDRLRLGQAALQLYAGPFLQHRQNVSWIGAYRARLHARWVQLVLDIAADWRTVGQRNLALELLLNVLEQDPEQFEVARRAMVLLREAGRLHEAMDLYARIRSVYRRLFGTDPVELKRLAAELRGGAAVDTSLE